MSFVFAFLTFEAIVGSTIACLVQFTIRFRGCCRCGLCHGHYGCGGTSFVFAALECPLLVMRVSVFSTMSTRFCVLIAHLITFFTLTFVGTIRPSVVVFCPRLCVCGGFRDFSKASRTGTYKRRIVDGDMGVATVVALRLFFYSCEATCLVRFTFVSYSCEARRALYMHTILGL